MISKKPKSEILYRKMPEPEKPTRGRPATGVGVPVMVRCQPDFLEAIDSWRRRQDDPPNRSEAIRRLVEMGIASDT